MKILAKKLSLNEFNSYVEKKDFGKVPPSFVVLHHTWKPTKAEWNGAKSIEGLKKYYEGLGWSAGPHLFISEDGIWLFTDMYEVGIHAGEGNGSLKTGYSIGIEVVGNYDNEVWSGKTYNNTVGALKILMDRLNIAEDKIKFHREYSSKSCPGKSITKEWVINQLNENMSEEKDYHVASKLVNVLQKFWSKFDGDKEESHKEMADKLEKFIKELEDENTKLTKLNKDLIIEGAEIIERKNIEIEEERNKLTTQFNGILKEYQEETKKLKEAKPVEKIVYQDTPETLTELTRLQGEVKILNSGLENQGFKALLTAIWNKIS